MQHRRQPALKEIEFREVDNEHAPQQKGPYAKIPGEQTFYTHIACCVFIRSQYGVFRQDEPGKEPLGSTQQIDGWSGAAQDKRRTQAGRG